MSNFTEKQIKAEINTYRGIYEKIGEFPYLNVIDPHKIVNAIYHELKEDARAKYKHTNESLTKALAFGGIFNEPTKDVEKKDD